MLANVYIVLFVVDAQCLTFFVFLVSVAVQQSQPLSNGEQQPQRLPLDIREIESLRYRVTDVCRAVTSQAVKEARLAELRHEILASQQLRSHFEDNPEDARVSNEAYQNVRYGCDGRVMMSGFMSTGIAAR